MSISNPTPAARTLQLLLTAVLLYVWTQSAWTQEPAVENRWESAIQAFEQADRDNPPPAGAILFIGSSSIRMWRTLAEDFAPLSVVNRGFGGSRIADSTYFADRIVIPYRPRQIVFYAGDNDLAAGHTPQQVLTDFRSFVNRVRRDLPNIDIAFVSIKPSLAREQLLGQMQIANDLVRGYTAQQPGLSYIDVFSAMLDGDGSVRTDLFIADGLHMNAAGYDIWATIIRPRLLE